MYRQPGSPTVKPAGKYVPGNGKGETYMRTLSVAAIRRERRHNGEKGFTLIELLVVVTIIGILAAIVSVSVGGFTGQATTKSRKTSLFSVQNAVDTFNVDNVDGSGVIVAPTGAATGFSTTSSTDWYGTNGKTGPAFTDTGNGSATFRPVSIAQLTAIITTTIAGTVFTRGPYLRSTANAITCVFATTNVDSELKGDNTIATTYKVVACKDST